MTSTSMSLRPGVVLLVIGAALSLAGTTRASDLPTAQEVFDRYREAIGGSEALEKVGTMAAEFTFFMPTAGVSAPGRAWARYPDQSYSRVSLEALGTTDVESGTSGEVAWQQNPQMGLRVLQGDERRIALHASRLDPFARWKELWTTAVTTAEVTIGNDICYEVVLTPPDGQPLSAYFARESGLLLREDLPVPAMGGLVTTTFSDFREVGGIVSPFRIEQQGLAAFVISYTRLRYNVGDIPPGTFDLPEAIQEAAATGP